jgi:hypothetical protein
VNTLYAEGSTRWTPALTLWSSKRNSQRKNIGMAIPHVTGTPLTLDNACAASRGEPCTSTRVRTRESRWTHLSERAATVQLTTHLPPDDLIRLAQKRSLVLQLHRRHAPDVICGAPREREIRLCEELERTLLRSAKPAACAQIRVGLVLVGCGHRVERANECVCRHPRLHLPSLDVVVLAHRMRQQLFHRPLLPPTQRRAQREQRPGGAEGVREEAAAATYF